MSEVSQAVDLAKHGPEPGERSFIRTLGGTAIHWRTWIYMISFLAPLVIGYRIFEMYGPVYAIFGTAILTKEIHGWGQDIWSNRRANQ